MKSLEILLNYYPEFIAGTKVTLQLTFVGLIVGFVVGMLAALGRVYGGKWIRSISIAYIELFRGTPLLVQLFVVYFGLPDFGITLSRMNAAMIVLAINSGAYQAEYFRGAIQSIGSGQFMAARSIGMSRLQAVRHIILPQAMRIVIPAWSNEPISLMKASAVVFLIAVPDLMTQGKIVASRTYAPLPTYFVVAFIYLVLVFTLSAVLNRLEVRFKIPGLEIEAHRA
jgi:polar amino acid transport system permease protein